VRVVSLFSGIGAATLGVHAHFPQAETVLLCEADKYARQVLALRFPGVDIVDDVRDLQLQRGAADLIEAGFPCQDLSVAGRKAGLDGQRSGLYGEVLRLVEQVQPRLVLLENVPTLLRYRGRLEREFAALGYGLTWCRIAAAHIGAPHRRLRVVVLAERGGSHRGVVDAGPLPDVGAWPTVTTGKGGEARRGGSRSDERLLAGAVQPPERWATPTTQDGKNNAGPSQHDRNSRPLNVQAGGKLSPDWVEALQGLPVGWTDLGCGAPRVVGWPAPMVRGMWGESPQHADEPPRTVAGKMAHRPARLRALGNCNPPQQYTEALRLLERGPAQRSLFDMMGSKPCE